MAKPTFRAKQFTIQQDRCAQKVSTDGILFGAWLNYCGAERILDVGAGTGVLSLIAAQRNLTAEITALEIDPAAAEQARENAANSRWPARIKVLCCDARSYQPESLFDLVICNPPYYANSLTSPDQRTNVAKHSEDLTFQDLVCVVGRSLTPDGRFAVIIPVERENDLVPIAAKHNLHPAQRFIVSYSPHKSPKRVLMMLKRIKLETVEESSLIIQNAGPFDYSPEYRAMISDLMIGL
ncbi:MAG TPA: methyltransferase [Flavobacteriales bacterium]|nr:methyltransferase [Flavobacteriales bacterium]